jgi:hypothetical protein
MHKAKRVLLSTALLAVFAGGVKSADRAGIGLEWAVGPTVSLSGFDMQMDQTFSVNWAATEAVTLGVFGQTGAFRGEESYSNDTGSVPFDEGIQVNGGYTLSGVRISYQLPMLTFLRVGFDLGVAHFTETQVDYHNGDGSVGSVANWESAGGARDSFDVAGAVEGFHGKVKILSAGTGALNAELGVNAGLRFIQFADTYVFGNQEVTTTKPAGEKDGIDPITSYNHLSVQVALNLGF